MYIAKQYRVQNCLDTLWHTSHLTGQALIKVAEEAQHASTKRLPPQPLNPTESKCRQICLQHQRSCSVNPLVLLGLSSCCHCQHPLIGLRSNPMNPKMPTHSMQARNASDATHRHPQEADECCPMKPPMACTAYFTNAGDCSHMDACIALLDSKHLFLLSVCLKSSAAVFSSESFTADKTTPGRYSQCTV